MALVILKNEETLRLSFSKGRSWLVGLPEKPEAFRDHMGIIMNGILSVLMIALGGFRFLPIIDLNSKLLYGCFLSF